MLQIMFRFTVIYYGARSTSFVHFSSFLMNCFNQVKMDFAVVITDSNIAVAWNTKHLFLAFAKSTRVPILHDTWLTCNTSVIEVAFILWLHPLNTSIIVAVLEVNAKGYFSWPKRAHIYSAHSLLATTCFMALAIARSLGK